MTVVHNILNGGIGVELTQEIVHGSNETKVIELTPVEENELLAA